MAARVPINTINSGGNAVLAASQPMTLNATMAPIMTTSPCAKLMS